MQIPTTAWMQIAVRELLKQRLLKQRPLERNGNFLGNVPRLDGPMSEPVSHDEGSRPLERLALPLAIPQDAIHPGDPPATAPSDRFLNRHFDIPRLFPVDLEMI